MAEVSVEKLRTIVTKALQDNAYAEKLFQEPEAVAREQGLTADETLVVKQMNREQFDQARKDAAAYSEELSDQDLEGVAGGTLTTTSATLGTATNMVIGRCIISATGDSYVDLSVAGCGCCAWKGGISTDLLILPV